ncbi:MAG: restriction endonuclease subunit S [Parabacteroides sp.]|nr:restriction endonuclease subunit S [Parabacteroides sp.]MDY4757482.1 restriction endonuclease subunit S [Parabacteroides sp.]
MDKTKWENTLIKGSIKALKVKAAVQKKDYLLTGKYPVISQEKEFISGYCNTEDNLNEILEDVIIFGDHTRIVKYVDFDFCVGADGVKVLRPDNKLSAKYLYYFIKWANIPSNGYSRHFKFLKEIEIKYPKDKSIQQAIASELDAIQTMIDGYKAQLEDLDALAQSIFLDMFGDPITNPKEWVIDKLGNHIKVIGGYAFKSGSFLESGVPVLRIGNINSGVFKKDNLVFWQENNKLLRYKIYPGDLVISLTGTVGKSDYANVCILDRSYPMYYLNQRNAKLELSNDIGKSYLTWLLKHKHIKNKLTKISRGIRQANMSNKDIEELIIPLPPLTLQQDFANQVEAIEKQKELIKSQLADAETLMAERMQYYFS